MVSNKEIAQAFKEAKNYLRVSCGDMTPGKSTYICFALEKAQSMDLITLKCFHTARNIIKRRLCGLQTLDDWLIHCAKIPYSEINLDCNKEGARKLQATRQAWLDSLIKEFEEKL